MARPSNKDPLDRFRWAVRIDGFTRSGFTGCEVPSFTINAKTYPEGGAHLFPKKIVDSIDYAPITLTRGVTTDESFHLWAMAYFDFLNGNLANTYKRDIAIDHLNRAGNVVKTYMVYNAFPIEYKPASEFSSDGDDTLSIEKIVLTYEAFEVVPVNTDTNPNDPRGLVERLINRF